MASTTRTRSPPSSTPSAGARSPRPTANAFQAPFRSGATVEAYQLEPLRRALQSARTNLLLADDVGLGKTIEAGLVLQELLLRHRARSVIIVCPPSLSLKWQDEMREKFGLDFVIVNSELMAGVRRSHGCTPTRSGCSRGSSCRMAWLPRAARPAAAAGRVRRRQDTGTARRYAFDLLIVDEAHHVAPASPSAVAGCRGYAVDTQRTIASASRWPTSASTGCSCPPRRTTATPSRSPR